MRQSIIRLARAELAAVTRAPLAAPALRARGRAAASQERHIVLPLQMSRRDYREGAARLVEEEPKRGLRISHLFGGLAILGMFVTIYGLLEYYYALDTWPEEVRAELKKAVRAKNRGDAIRSEAAFRQALEIAKSMPLEAFEPDPLLKLTGISVTLSSLLESQGQLAQSYKVLADALAFLDSQSAEAAAGPGKEDRIRAIGLSQKLGSLALVLSRRNGDEYDQMAETHLSRALNDMMAMASIAEPKGRAAGESTRVVGRDFKFDGDEADAPEDASELPGKLTRKRMGKTMETLADLYAKRGQFDLANPLYVQAITTLLPSNGGDASRAPRKASAEDICQACTLMNTLSSGLLNPPSKDNIVASRAWSNRSLSLTERALASLDEKDKATREAPVLCGRARVVAENNLGVLAEMSSDIPEASKYLNRSIMHAEDMGFREGAREAAAALKRLQSLSKR